VIALGRSGIEQSSITVRPTAALPMLCLLERQAWTVPIVTVD
jgi:hypothetical protein